jgi:hypothetical protein
VTYIHARKDTLGIAKFRSWCGCIITAPNSTADVERVTCGKCWQKLKEKMRRRAAEISAAGKTPAKKEALTRLRKKAAEEQQDGKHA